MLKNLKDNYINRYEFQNVADVGDFPLQIAMSLKGTVHYFPEHMVVYRHENSNKDSWTNRKNSNNDYKIKYLYNELRWLNSFDKITDYKFHESVLYRQSFSMLELYIDKEKKFIDLKKHIEKINKKERLQIIKALLRHTIMGTSKNYEKNDFCEIIKE